MFHKTQFHPETLDLDLFHESQFHPETLLSFGVWQENDGPHKKK